MGISLPLLLSVGTGGLTVETDSPDALCPPLEEAQQVIASRVGKVQGGDYRVRYRLVYDAEQGHNGLEFELREGDSLVLQREIPLGDADCSDAALAMALILERYFESAFELGADTAVESSEVKQPADDVSSGTESHRSPGRVEPQALDEPSPATSQPRPGSEGPRLTESVEQERHPFWLRTHADLAQGLVAQVGIGLELSSRSWWSVLLDTNFQLFRDVVQSDGYSVGTLRHGVALVPSYVLRMQPTLSLHFGLYLGAQVQIAQLLGDQPSEKLRAQARVLPAAGAQLEAAWGLSSRMRLGFFGRFITLISGSSFVVERNGGGRTEVLPLPALAWETGVSWALGL